jgi:L-ascorbate metabolism protein UlaG (beta-lactamase superfamily)
MKNRNFFVHASSPMALGGIAAALLLAPGCLFGQAIQAVKITPLGSKTGEFCFWDRAMVLEDPTGVRMLYDPGTTVAGSTDPRLGSIDVALLSHVHSDHIGDAKLNQDPDATDAKCDPSVPTAPVVPNSNLAEIVGAKKAAFVGAGGVASFLTTRIAGLGGVCGGNPFSSAPIVAPPPAPCISPLFFGGKRIVKRAGAESGVQISVVTAKHHNGIPPTLLSDPLKTDLGLQGLTPEAGEPVGYVVKFTNGLTVYLSGDTGQTTDMSTVIREQYKADLAIINIGDAFTTGPEEAAFAMNNLVRPKSVIPSHANEVATSGGKVNPGSRTAQFLGLIEMPGYVPLSGRTMQFDSQGHCVAGCM